MDKMLKTKFMDLVIILVLLLNLAGVLPVNCAESPRLVPFQGRLTDAQGDPLHGVYEIIFAIYDEPTGGNHLWLEKHPSVSVINGTLNVLLGSLTLLDDPDGNGNTGDAVKFDAGSGSRYLGIKVGDESNQEMIPRHQLVPAFHARTADHATKADYATEAGNSDKLDGLDSTAFLSATSLERLTLRRPASETTGGKIVFLDLLQSDVNHVNQPTVPPVYPSIRFVHAYRFWHRIEGRPTGIHFKTGDLNYDNCIDIFARAFRGDCLDISATGSTQFEFASRNGGNPYIDFKNDPDSDYDMRLILYGDDNLTVTGGAFVVDNNLIIHGNTGIGTSSPSYKLDVAGDIRASGSINSGGTINAKDFTRNGQAFSKAGVASHGQTVYPPWGKTYDWNIFVSGYEIGKFQSGNDSDNAIHIFNCCAEANDAKTGWKITAKCFYRDKDEKKDWIYGKANYLLVPK